MRRGKAVLTLAITISTVHPLGSISAQNQSDSLVIARYLRERRLILSSVMDWQGPYVAALARARSDNDRRLIAIAITDKSAVSLGLEVQIGPFTPHVMWVSLGSRVFDGLVVTMNYPTEGVVRTEVFHLVDRRLVPVYQDPSPSCRSAQLRDLDADGKYELVVYRRDSLAGVCEDPCHSVLESRFGVTPDWPSVHSWTGDKWVLAENQHPWFYAQTAANYQVLRRWLEESSSSTLCRTAPWRQSPSSLFRGRETRAQRIAGSNRRR